MQTSRYTVMITVDDTPYAYNALTGGLAKVTNERICRLLAGETSADSPLSAEEEQSLRRGGFLLPDGLDELLLIRYRRELSRFDSAVLTLVILPTLDCNFDCVYCYEQNKRPVYMDDATADALVAWVARRVGAVRVVGVTWYGGEPLCGLDRIRDLSVRLRKMCQDSGVRYQASVVTNGYLMTPKVADELHGLDVRSVQVSIDGPPEVHDKRRPLKGGQATFGRIVDNLVHASRLFPISLRLTVDKTNLEAAVQTSEVLRSRGIICSAMYLGRTMSMGECSIRPEDCFGNEEMQVRLCELLDSRQLGGVNPMTFYPRPTVGSCVGTQANSFVICPDGSIHRCLETVDNPEEAVGRIQDEEPMIEAVLKWYALDALDHDECRNCIVLPLCLGGCPYRWRLRGKPECLGSKNDLPRVLEAQARYALWQRQSTASQAGE